MRALACWAALGALAACGNGERRPPASQAPRPAKPSLRIVALTDLSGYLEPCGCQTRPLGGIDKAAAALAQLGADGVPSLVIAAGDLFFEAAHGHAAAGTEDELRFQQRAQAETLADALGRLGLAAATLGPADVAHDAAFAAKLAERGRIALLGSTASGGLARRSVERGGLEIGLLGVTSPAGSDVREAAHALQAEIDALRAEGAALVIALMSADARAGRRLAGSLKRLDFALHGGLASAAVAPPERVGTTTLLRAAHNGHGLLVIDVFRAGEGELADVSAWTREAEAQALERRSAELRARIASWERDPAVDRGQLEAQRASLRGLEQERAARSTRPSGAGNAFSARFVELAPELPGEPAMRALMAAHDARINEHNRKALAGAAKLPVPPDTASYVGSARCGECHESEHAWWRGHAHGRAYATLVERNKQFNLSCVGCHVTGYGKPGGAAVVQNEGLVDVGCESCHGPGSLHAEDQDVDASKNVVLDPSEALCKTCHNPEHSDAFVHAKYEAELIVPGHGLPEPK